MALRNFFSTRSDQNGVQVASNSRPLRTAGVMKYEVEDDLTLYDPDSQVVHILNSSAAAIWELCDGTRGIEEIASHIASYYGMPVEEVTGDVRELVAQLEDARLLQKRASI